MCGTVVPMTERATSLRERNRLRTRQAISDVATRLFLERGFDRVTIADVATAAGVAKMTVTNHFPRKEDLVFDIHEDLVASLAAAVTARGPGESALDALRRHCLDGLRDRAAAFGFSDPEFAGMVTASAPLRARLREIREQQEDALAAVLATETAAGPDDLAPRIAAGQLAAIVRVLSTEVMTRTQNGQDAGRIARDLAAPTRRAFDTVKPSLGSYAVRTD